MIEIKWYEGIVGLHGGVNVLNMDIRHMIDMTPEQYVLTFIGNVAGECYNAKRTDEACINRALGCIKRGHHSPFEHVNITLNCLVDRGTSHALVRHRHCAFMQSSTIYQRFNNVISIINLPEIDPCSGEHVQLITPDELCAYNTIACEYLNNTGNGMPPGRARDVLPNALATNLIITTNMRQWQYMFRRRCGPGDAPRMHCWAALVRNWFELHYPRITAAFDCWYDKHPL